MTASTVNNITIETLTVYMTHVLFFRFCNKGLHVGDVATKRPYSDNVNAPAKSVQK